MRSLAVPMLPPTMLAVCIVACFGHSGYTAGLRVASWNMNNRPNDDVHDSYLRAILEAIGNETIPGHARPLDILSMSETDGPSALQTANKFNELYRTASYVSVVTVPDGGNDRTGFVYNSSTVSLIGTEELSKGLTHNTLRGDFRPVEIAGAPVFHMYSIHLKSGDDKDEQADEAE